MSTIVFELFLPLIATNVLHMFVVKADAFALFKIPLCVSLFGQNKTLRGVVFVCTANGFFTFLFSALFLQTSQWATFALGTCIGLVYVLCELPNSFLKRRLKIPAGNKPQKFRLLFLILDKCDSTFGVCLIYVMLRDLSVVVFISMFLTAFFVHLSLSQALFLLKIKESV